jgi:hypothetical protein
MAEYLPKDWRDQVSFDPDTGELERAEEALFLSAKSGSLFEPEMDEKEWAEFCKAATLEEEERKSKVPKSHSQLTPEQRKILKHGGENVKSPGVKKILKRREKLVERLRPQCVDADDSGFEEELLDDLGMTADEFKQVSPALGEISPKEWEDLEKRNQPKEE